MLNDFFDKIYCINLDRRIDRWESLSMEIKRIGLEVERVSAIDGKYLKPINNLKTGALALTLTVKNIFNDAILNNYNKILILEDDVVFTENIINFNHEISELPNNWDLLYFGGNHNTHCGYPPPHKINDYFCKLNHTFSSHAIGFNYDAIRLVKNILEYNIKEIDVIYSEIQKTNNVYCFNKLLATQSVGYSDIENNNVNYNYLIK